MKRYLLSFLLLPAFAFTQAPIGYYSGTEGLGGYALKTRLHEIISERPITWHYGDLPAFYGITDLDHHYDFDATNDRFLLDIYSNRPDGTTAYHYDKEQLVGSAGAEGIGYNREHMMPQSSFNSNYPMYSDLFFVIPTDARINQLRSNYPYGVAGTPVYYTFTNGSKIAKNATPGSAYTGRVYEPHDEFKGDVARSLLYYAVRYQSKLPSFNVYNGSSPANDTNPLDGSEEKAFEDWYLAMLLKWHADDPVSPREQERNEAVFALQRNRNPFIDHPEWVQQIWAEKIQAAPVAPVHLQATTVSAFFATLNWQPNASENVLGYRIYQNGILLGSTRKTEFIADHLQPNTPYEFVIKAYNNQYIESGPSETLMITTLTSDIYARDLMITKYVEGSDDNRALEITNRTGHAVDLNKYRLSIQFYSGTNYYFPAPYELEGTIGHNESFVILNPRAQLSCVNNDEAKFVSAAPQMTFSGSNYVELRYANSAIDAIGSRDLNNYEMLQDVSLYRLPTVEQPTRNFTLSEWTAHPIDFCEGIGTLSADQVPNSNAGKLSVFPNPVGNTLKVVGISLSAKSKIVIYDASGRIVLQPIFNGINGNTLQVQTLKPGVYTLQVERHTAKFIKK